MWATLSNRPPPRVFRARFPPNCLGFTSILLQWMYGSSLLSRFLSLYDRGKCRCVLSAQLKRTDDACTMHAKQLQLTDPLRYLIMVHPFQSYHLPLPFGAPLLCANGLPATAAAFVLTFMLFLLGSLMRPPRSGVCVQNIHT